MMGFLLLNITLGFQNKEETVKHRHVNLQLVMTELVDLLYSRTPQHAAPELACSLRQQPRNRHPGWWAKQRHPP